MSAGFQWVAGIKFPTYFYSVSGIDPALRSNSIIFAPTIQWEAAKKRTRVVEKVQ
jgi:hypothetical protein